MGDQKTNPPTPPAEPVVPIVPAVSAEPATPAEPEKTEISVEEREKFKIADKFKYWEDVVSWGTEAEKQKSAVETDKGKLLTQLNEYEEVISDLEKNLEAKEKKGEITTEEKEKTIEQFQTEFSENPVATMNKLFSAFEKRLESKQTKEKDDTNWDKEEAKLKVSEKYKGKWGEIKPELAKIAEKKPYLRTIGEVLAIYEQQQATEATVIKDDKTKKDEEKKGAFAETKESIGVGAKSVLDKIAGATSLEDLEKVASGIERAPERE